MNRPARFFSQASPRYTGVRYVALLPRRGSFGGFFYAYRSINLAVLPCQQRRCSESSWTGIATHHRRVP